MKTLNLEKIDPCSKVCATCKFWTFEPAASWDYNAITKGTCECPKFVYMGDGKSMEEDGLGYSDDESLHADFVTGPKFGCVHHEFR